jgi:hypothetical protein
MTTAYSEPALLRKHRLRRSELWLDREVGKAAMAFALPLRPMYMSRQSRS